MSHTVDSETIGAVRIVRINRPPANAIDLRLTAELLQAVQRSVVDSVGALVITGHGKFFSAGIDLRVIPRYGPGEQREMVANINHLVQALYSLPIPTVAAVNGHAIGGGMVLALCCDYRVAAESGARLGLTEARAAVPFPAAAMEVVRAELSSAGARVYSLIAETTDARDARRAGLVDDLVVSEEVFACACKQAERLAAVPHDSYRRVKHQLRQEACERIDDIVANGNDPMLDGWISAETSAAAAGLLKRGH